MNIKEQDKGYREMLERYIDAGKTSIEYQSDSFNSMDSKSQIYIGLLSVLAVFLIDRKPVFEDTHLSL